MRRVRFFFKNYAEDEAGRLVQDLFLFLKKCLNEVKASGSAALFQYISIVLNLGYSENKLYKTFDYCSRAQF